jgi:Gas vesicle synthesis protein GvpO
MAERASSKERQRRSDSRERRRALAAKPFEEMDEAARGEEQRETDGGRGSALKQAAAAATAGAVAAGLAGAAKAMLERRGEGAHSEGEPSAGAEERVAESPGQSLEPEDRERELDEPDNAGSEEQPQGEAQVTEESEPEAREETERRRDADSEQDEPESDDEQEEPQAAQSEQDEPESQDEQEEPQAAQSEQDEPESEDEQEEPQAQSDGSDHRGRRGAPAGEAREVVAEARRELKELLGTEPERVSAFQRSDHGWTVMLEVVDLRRVPDSTDVLSSYEVILDDDRNLVSVAQKRRYRRSQVDEEG